MAKVYDILCIGLGPAGMAVSAMAAAMGLNVVAIEKNKLGGECMNCGCVPSKALLKRAKVANFFKKIEEYQFAKISGDTKANEIFSHIRNSIDYINKVKNSKMMDKVNLISGDAHFIDAKTVEVNGEQLTAKKIFICTGTKPAVPPIEGIKDVEFLTNESLFEINEIPKSLTIIGGGAIGTEMAEAFKRLGAERVTIVHDGEHLIPLGDDEASKVVEENFKEQGIEIFNKRFIKSVKKDGNEIVVTTADNEEIRSDKLLLAAGRSFAPNRNLDLDKAGVALDKRGAIVVNDYLQTSNKDIYAVGDCNGNFLFSHAAMHQAIVAIMNVFIPIPFFKKKFKKYVVPWTVFTDPAFSAVGMGEKELKEKGVKYEVIKASYTDYGVAYIENSPKGFVKVFASPFGKIYGAVIVGENSGELINEWAMAIHNNVKLYNILMQQHSFPTMGFLNKRISEIWLMGKMDNPKLKGIFKRILSYNFI